MVYDAGLDFEDYMVWIRTPLEKDIFIFHFSLPTRSSQSGEAGTFDNKHNIYTE